MRKLSIIGLKWLTMIAASIHWFNPLMYFIKKEINHACELACDEAVIKDLNPTEKQAYGDTLISVVAEHKYPIGVLQATMSEEKETLKERLVAIMQHSKKSKIIILMSLVLLIVVISGAVVLGVSSENQTTKDTTTQKELDTQTGTMGSDTSPAIKTDSGSYVGQADNNSIEIRISGVQDDKLAFRVFKISDEVRQTFESLSLKKDDAVKFSYYEQVIGQPVLIKINVAVPAVKPGDFFPVVTGSTWEYQGEGNEYASFNRKVLFTNGNLAQIREANGGTVSAAVFKISPESVTRIFFKGEAYDDQTDYLNSSSNENIVILKAPLQVGTKWTEPNGTREIVDINATVATPAGSFTQCVKVKISNENSTLYEYYKMGVGMVKREFIAGDTKVTSSLKKHT